MEEFQKKRVSISEKDMRKVNRCQLFLQATTLADITSADGFRIRLDSYMGKLNRQTRDPLATRPKQTKLSQSDWTMWRKALFYTFGATNTNHNLGTKLKRWYEQVDWLWYYSASTDRIYFKLDKDGDKWIA